MIILFIDRTVRLTKSVLKDAELRPEDVDILLLGGGSTRITLARERLSRIFSKQPEVSLTMEEVVALGAAIQVGIISGNVRKAALVDVTP